MKTLLPKMVHITSSVKWYRFIFQSLDLLIWCFQWKHQCIILLTNALKRWSPNIYFAFVLQIVFNIQLTLPLHRQKQYMQLHTPLSMGKGISSYLEYFLSLSPSFTMSSMENTQTRETTNRKPYFLKRITAGNLAQEVK